MKTMISMPLSRTWRNLTGADRICLAVFALILVAWTLMPAIAQNSSYHRFADQRQWLGIPHAADLLSNFAFALVGVAGVVRLASRRRLRFSPVTEGGMWWVAVGLVCTAIGSAWYHRDPTDSTLFWDRLPMTLVFAGVLGAAMAQRIGSNVGRLCLVLLLPLGIASVLYWKMTGDLSLYLTLQYGGIGALALLLVLTRRGDDPIPWAWVVAWYVLAKAAELADREIWDLTGGMIAGHSLKHLLAAVAGAAALWPLRARH